jgi:ubiquinone/menaquinone biosynthesis C-methylase UbiE
MKDVADSYSKGPEHEWNRLVRDPYHTIEFSVYMHHVTTHLKPGALILDAGGGPGRYSIELSRRGYEVVLLDISEGLIELAKAKIKLEAVDVRGRIKDVVAGDVSDLSQFPDDSFDAVLCLDPLSHLPESNRRESALAELVRVARAQALVALSVRGYLAVLRAILRVDSKSLTDGSLEQLRMSGNTTVGGQLCHFFRAKELRELAEAQGLEIILMAGAEGLSEGLPEATNVVFEDQEKWERWTQLVLETSTDPTVVDMSGHMLYIGRKS